MTDVAPEEKTTITITLNGNEVEVAPDKMLIDAVEAAGEYIPRFCYHERMTPVGMCRMCLVEVDTGRGPALTPSCMIKPSPGMVVDTESDTTKRAQDGVLELLLINHPLDCPVCDKGGECPLQDQTVSYGPGESRYIEEKRHYEKPIPINDNVFLDRERCILCDRCTRFADEVAGDALIHFIDRGNNTQVNTFPDEPFSSYFSGNVVQICPVGALTAKPYRFKARPWDLTEVETTLPNAMGDRIVVQSSRDQVVRYQGVDSDAVNWGWLADRDRFGFEAIANTGRITTPLVRGSGLNQPDPAGTEMVGTTWLQAMSQVETWVRHVLKDRGPQAIAAIGGSRFTNESAYAWTKFIKGVLGSDNLDCQLDDGLSGEIVASLPRATIDEVCAPGSTVVVLSGDPKEELGTLFLRLRHAAINDGVSIIELTPTRTGLSGLAKASLMVRPGDSSTIANALVSGTAPERVSDLDAAAFATASEAVRQAAEAGTLRVIAGRPSLAEAGIVTAEALNAFASLDGATFLSGLRRGNVNGAIDMGMAPGMLPGRVGLDDGRSWFTGHWPQVPSSPGMSTAGILEAAAHGKIGLLFLLGADPIGDFPDRALAERGLNGADKVVAIDAFANESVLDADIVLPAALFGETTGTHTNIEGRVTAISPKVTPMGTARPDWMIAAELADALEVDLGLGSVGEITAEIAAVSSLHHGATTAAIAASRDGVVATTDASSGAPAPMTWTPLASTVEPRPVDGYSYRLIADRTMYDQGTMVRHCPSLAELARPATVRVHRSEAARLGVADGVSVRVISSHASLELPLEVDDAVPTKCAAIAVNAPGGDVRTLIDTGKVFTEVRIETL